jgi:hypothetical protein
MVKKYATTVVEVTQQAALSARALLNTAQREVNELLMQPASQIRDEKLRRARARSVKWNDIYIQSLAKATASKPTEAC